MGKGGEGRGGEGRGGVWGWGMGRGRVNRRRGVGGALWALVLGSLLLETVLGVPPPPHKEAAFPVG